MRICRCLLVGIVALANGASAEGQILSYEATLLSDTVYVFEPVWVHFVARNLTSDTIPASPLELAEDRHSLSISDEKGASVVGSVVEMMYMPHPSDVIPPFGAKQSYAMLNHRSRIKDPVRREGCISWSYFPEGKYTAVFRWRYDPWRRARFNDSPYLRDTVVFHVVMPTGPDSLAMESYRDALRERGLRQTELLWESYRRFPSSPYAPECLMHVATNMHTPNQRIRDLPFRDLIRALAVLAPSYPGVVKEIKDAAGYNEDGDGWAEKSKSLDRAFLRSIADSVPPESRAGKICAGLLNGVENEVLHFTPVLKVKRDRHKD